MRVRRSQSRSQSQSATSFQNPRRLGGSLVSFPPALPVVLLHSLSACDLIGTAARHLLALGLPPMRFTLYRRSHPYQ